MIGSVWNGNEAKSGKGCCYKCNERQLGCHSKCEKYLAWKQEIALINKREHEATVVHSMEMRQMGKFYTVGKRRTVRNNE